MSQSSTQSNAQGYIFVDSEAGGLCLAKQNIRPNKPCMVLCSMIGLLKYATVTMKLEYAASCGGRTKAANGCDQAATGPAVT